MFKKIIEIIKNRYYLSSMKGVHYYEMQKEDLIKVENKNNTTLFEYINSKNLLANDSEQNIFKHFVSQQINDIPKYNQSEEKIKRTKSNHIIPCAYLAQWTIYNKINKGKNPPKQTIKVNGATQTLKSYMKIDYSLIQKVENMLVGQDEKSRAISTNWEKPVLREQIEELHHYKAMKDFELFYTNGKMKNNSKIDVLFVYNKINEKGFVNGKIEDIKRSISAERLASDKFIEHTDMYDARQYLWNCINKGQQKGLINIIRTILKDFESSKSFKKYINTLEILTTIFCLALMRSEREKIPDKINEIKSSGTLNVKELRKYYKDSIQKIVENKIYTEEQKKFICNTFTKMNESTINSIEKMINATLEQQQDLFFEEIKKIDNLEFNINNQEEIKFFLENLVVLIENYEGEINKEMTALINSIFLMDLYKERVKNLEASFIFYLPYKLSGSNLPFLNFFNWKMFAISPHLLMISGSEKSLKYVKLLKFLVGTLFIYLTYQILIHTKKEGHIIK